MNAIAMLERDHKKVQDLFRQFAKVGHSTRGLERKEQIATRAFDELDLHSELEEEIFYPALETRGDMENGDLVRKAVAEHHAVKRMIQELRGLPAESPQFDAKFSVLAENVDHHIDEERSEILPRAEMELQDRLNELGRKMAERKREHAGDGASLVGHTYREAKRAIGSVFESVVGTGSDESGRTRRRARPAQHASRRTKASPRQGAARKATKRSSGKTPPKRRRH